MTEWYEIVLGGDTTTHPVPAVDAAVQLREQLGLRGYQCVVAGVAPGQDRRSLKLVMNKEVLTISSVVVIANLAITCTPGYRFTRRGRGGGLSHRSTTNTNTGPANRPA